MNIYGLETTVSADGDIFNLRDPKARLSSYFIWNTGDDKSLRFSKPYAEAQELVKLKDVLSADYLQANTSIPIFSSKARDVLCSKIPDEVAFYECTVKCEGQENNFFLCKVHKHLPLVDKQQSQFRTLADGVSILTKAVYLDNSQEEFFIARDQEFCPYLVVSQHFVDLCRTNALHINFVKL